MSTLTIRKLEPQIKDKLRVAAAAHGRSMEEEVRSILRSALTQPAVGDGVTLGFGSRIHARFAALGAVELNLPERVDLPRVACFEEDGTGSRT